jgi:hypothetical protein
MRALKILVVVMGVMLVAGTVALVLAIASRVGKLSSSAAPAVAGGGEELLVFNLANGARIATIKLRTAPAAP